MSTYLQICQDVARECGIAGGDTVPSTVAGQSGELQRVVNWVADAWLEIQNRHRHWRWMRVGFTVDTVASDDTYAFGDVTDVLTSSVIARFQNWRVDDPDDPPKIYLKSSGVGTEGWLIFVPWNDFKYRYKKGSQVDSYPAWLSIDPQDNLVLGPKPNDVYVVTGDYQRSAQVLAADGDVPEMPTQYHDLIKFWAKRKYGLYESAQEVITDAELHIDMHLRDLEVNQLPDVAVPEPLA